jgi:hypothetical protein
VDQQDHRAPAGPAIPHAMSVECDLLVVHSLLL